MEEMEKKWSNTVKALEPSNALRVRIREASEGTEKRSATLALACSTPLADNGTSSVPST